MDGMAVGRSCGNYKRHPFSAPHGMPCIRLTPPAPPPPPIETYEGHVHIKLVTRMESDSEASGAGQTGKETSFAERSQRRMLREEMEKLT